MEVGKVNVNSLFEDRVQYRIPLFQRHYVWDEENQWEPLWADIENQLSQVPPDERGASLHFTGAIVIQSKPPLVGDIRKYEIIDGQQRLTTFQIILCAIRDVCRSHGYDDSASDVSLYLRNQGTRLSKRERFKLIPTKFDRDEFKSLVNGNGVVSSTHRLYSAYRYFKDKIADCVKSDEEKILALFDSLRHNFGLVQVLLGPNDEPEKIFESLNARGKPLLQFDLLRNNLFLRADGNRDELYEKSWAHFETSYWDPENDKEGTSSELFLQHFLMAKLGQPRVKPEFNVYDKQYRRKLKHDNNVKHELSELKRYAEVYKEMTDCEEDSEIGKRMKFYQTFDFTSLHPFMLFIICEVRLSGDKFQHVFDILESYTVRRMLCYRGKSGLKNYNIFFSQLIRDLRNDFSLENFIEQLKEQTSDTRKYPIDDEIEPALSPTYDEHSELFADDSAIIFPDNRAVKAALHGLWTTTAGGIKQRLIRYILYRIELKMSENK